MVRSAERSDYIPTAEQVNAVNYPSGPTEIKTNPTGLINQPLPPLIQFDIISVVPIIKPEIYGCHPRDDGKPGHLEVTATTQKFVEADHTDVRLNRVRVYDQDGNLEHTYLRDTMGVRFCDDLGLADDEQYVASLLIYAVSAL